MKFKKKSYYFHSVFFQFYIQIIYQIMNLNNSILFENEILYKQSIESYYNNNTYESSLQSSYIFSKLNIPYNYNSNEDYDEVKCDNLKNKIFLIEKINKKERLDSNIIFESKISNNRIDNILRKIKVHFFKFIINLCNDFIKKENKDSRMKIRSITTDLSTDVTVELNLLLKQCTVKQVLTFPINDKFLKPTKDINKKIISKIIKKYPSFNNILKLTIKDIFDYFANPNFKSIIESYGKKKATTLYELVEKNKRIKKLGKDYIKKFLYVGNNFFSNFKFEKRRNRQVKKKILSKLREILRLN